MKNLKFIAAIAAGAFALGASSSHAQVCYFRAGSNGELCESNGDRGLDSSCQYPCAVTVTKTGERQMMIFKDNKWVPPERK